MPRVGTIEPGSQSATFTGIAGVNDNDIVIETEDISRYDTFLLMSTAGAMDLTVSLDGNNFTTAVVSLADLGAASTDPVLVTVAGRLYGFRGVVKKIRVEQNGATAVVNAVLMMKSHE